MEEYLYMKGFSGPREWCSEKVELKPYFEQYSLLLLENGLPPKTATEVDILQHFVPQANQLSEGELNTLFDITNTSHLTDMSDLKKPKPNRRPKANEERNPGQRGRKGCTKLGSRKDKETELNNLEAASSKGTQIDETSQSKGPQKYKPSSSDGPQSSKGPQGPNNFGPSSSKGSQEREAARWFASKKPNRLSGAKWGSRCDIILKDETPQVGPRDLVANCNFVVSFRVHEPFFHRDKREALRPGKCTQQITVLDQQPLTALRDMIVCAADFQDVRGDISERPGSPVTVRAMDTYQSSMFYFDNTFYVDSRSPDRVDYSAPIREWALQRGISASDRRPMEATRVDELTVRLGYPYVYMHQGNCEHILVVSDARLLTVRDSLHSSSYPQMVKISTQNCNLCMSCAIHPARWIVRECDRLSHDPMYQCDRCFFEFHYVDGKKVGEFKAYKFWQRSII